MDYLDTLIVRWHFDLHGSTPGKCNQSGITPGQVGLIAHRHWLAGLAVGAGVTLVLICEVDSFPTKWLETQPGVEYCRAAARNHFDSFGSVQHFFH